jgi:hypothetical protein
VNNRDNNMKQSCYSFLAAAGLLAVPAAADVIEIDISPPGTSPGIGLSPANEPHAVTSDGSGGEIFGGITFDTDTRVLAYTFGYGLVAGFTNTTGPATAAHIHGPALVGGTAPPIHDFFAVMDHLPAGYPADGGLIVGSVTLDPASAAQLRAGRLYINIHTEDYPAGELRGQLIEVVGNLPPSCSLPEPESFECESADGTTVVVDASLFDPDGDPLEFTWTIDGVEHSSGSVPSGGDVTDVEISVEETFGLGEHEIELSVSDGVNEPVICATTVTVVDTIAPEITGIRPSTASLWPPNHKMVPVRIRVDVTDICGEVTTRIVGVESNEPVNGTGDGDTAPDWEITGDLTVDLRAERAGTGDGRVYTIEVEAVDGSGNSTTGTTSVRVPKSQGNSGRWAVPTRRPGRRR